MYREYYPDDYFIDSPLKLPKDHVFVFGSNEAGRHGKGAAKTAINYFGAIYGLGLGLDPYRLSYAIPTKDKHLRPLSLQTINNYVGMFIYCTHSERMSDKRFFITKIGCGLAGNQPSDIAPMFKTAANCVFPESWSKYLE